MSNSPPDCCIEWVRFPLSPPKKAPPIGQCHQVSVSLRTSAHTGVAIRIFTALENGFPRQSEDWLGMTEFLNLMTLTYRVVLFGGAEGNRTPVRRQLDKTFSERSLLFTFPHPDGNKHPAGFSSCIMHGTRKALCTHVLYSDHTRARLVDLPGRMGA